MDPEMREQTRKMTAKSIADSHAQVSLFRTTNISTNEVILLAAVNAGLCNYCR